MSRVIRIDDDLYQALGKLAKPFESPKTVIRRLLRKAGIGTRATVGGHASRGRLATQRMRAVVRDGTLQVEFENGAKESWKLPKAKTDRDEIRRVRDRAVDFARAQGATEGQRAAVKRALTEHGYHIGTPRRSA